MEYGIWILDRKDSIFHTLRECRHHGLQEFYSRSSRGRLGWGCLECKKQYRKGVRTSKVAGCPYTVGLVIAEEVLSKAFLTMVKAPSKASFDFTGPCGLKIDSKCSTLEMSNGKIGQHWKFSIDKNKVPDVFCLIALENFPNVEPKDAKPIHVWLIRGDTIIDGRPLNDRTAIFVTPRTLARLEPYRRMDMEGRIIKCCSKLKEKED